jgi:hypothetical protein
MKRPALFLFLIILLKAAAALAQPISGTVTRADSRAALPYVNIGVVGKSLGTVSSEQGAYRLAFQEALADDTVRISSLGFRARLLTLRTLQAQPNVALEPESVSLQEVQVQSKSLFKRQLTLGNTSNNGPDGTILHLNTKDLGAEMGMVIHLKSKPTRVLTANFNVAYNEVGPLTLRVNLYRLDKKGRPTDAKLLAHDLIVTSAIEKGTLTVDLTKEQVVVDEDFFLALEWIKNSSPAEAQPVRPMHVKATLNATAAPRKHEGLAFSASVGYSNNDLYLRSTSQGNWERASVGAVLAGMQPRISFFVTAQD